MNDWIQDKINLLHPWVMNHLFSWSMGMQLLMVLCITICGYLFAKRTSYFIYNANAQLKKQNLLTPNFIRLYYMTLFFWIGVGTLKGLDLSYGVLKTIASLISAWTVIHMVTSALRSKTLSKVLSISLWALAFLNIIGYLSAFTNLLQNTTFSLGEVNFSLLHLLKSVVACSFVLWITLALIKLVEKRFQKVETLTPAQKVLFSKLSTVALYGLAGIISLNIVGLDLSTLALFSGALGLGIGFGLQKIFSNLISGFILLLDKSVKPGDVIGVSNTYGWINSLGARYVSVLTRDGKEHLIPNEDLITNRVENWSHSSSRVRIHLPIGVAYNSDLHKVKELLLTAATSHPRILTDPAPKCLIRDFCDSSIEHELRLWISDPENGVGSLKSDIYYKIWDLFQENNIEIPFPQQAITIKSPPSKG